MPKNGNVRMPPSMLITSLSTGLICTPMIALTTGNTGGRSYFSSLDALRAQIAADVKTAGDLLRRGPGS